MQDHLLYFNHPEQNVIINKKRYSMTRYHDQLRSGQTKDTNKIINDIEQFSIYNQNIKKYIPLKNNNLKRKRNQKNYIESQENIISNLDKNLIQIIFLQIDIQSIFGKLQKLNKYFLKTINNQEFYKQLQINTFNLNDSTKHINQIIQFTINDQKREFSKQILDSCKQCLQNQYFNHMEEDYYSQSLDCFRFYRDKKVCSKCFEKPDITLLENFKFDQRFIQFYKIQNSNDKIRDIFLSQEYRLYIAIKLQKFKKDIQKYSLFQSINRDQINQLIKIVENLQVQLTKFLLLKIIEKTKTHNSSEVCEEYLNSIVEIFKNLRSKFLHKFFSQSNISKNQLELDKQITLGERNDRNLELNLNCIKHDNNLIKLKFKDKKLSKQEITKFYEIIKFKQLGEEKSIKEITSILEKEE